MKELTSRPNKRLRFTWQPKVFAVSLSPLPHGCGEVLAPVSKSRHSSFIRFLANRKYSKSCFLIKKHCGHRWVSQRNSPIDARCSRSSSVTSWMRCWPTQGRVMAVLKFPHLRIMAPTMLHQSPTEIWLSEIFMPTSDRFYLGGCFCFLFIQFVQVSCPLHFRQEKRSHKPSM